MYSLSKMKDCQTVVMMLNEPTWSRQRMDPIRGSHPRGLLMHGRQDLHVMLAHSYITVLTAVHVDWQIIWLIVDIYLLTSSQSCTPSLQMLYLSCLFWQSMCPCVCHFFIIICVSARYFKTC